MRELRLDSRSLSPGAPVPAVKIGDASRHERIECFTDTIFSISDTANLSLHNYTTFHNLLALPLQHVFGVVASFNIVFLGMMVVTAYAGFLLAREVSGRTAESWLAAVLFAWCPALVTRGTGHFSLASAAPLAVFALLLVRSEREQRRWLPFAFGAVLWWAASTDPYYGVYCVLMAAAYIGLRNLSLEPHAVNARARQALDVAIIAAALVVGVVTITGGGAIAIAGRAVSIRNLYTPVLVATGLLLLRVALRYRVRVSPLEWNRVRQVFRVAVISAMVTLILLGPRLYALAVRIAGSGLDAAPLFWRSGPNGVDLLGLLLPNPNHPLAPAMFQQWLTPRPDAYIENAASLVLTAAGTLIVAWRLGWRPPPVWTGFGVIFGLLALGPFLHVGGVNMYVPGPWALLRYVPGIGLARTPARFSVLLMLAGALLFATALTWLGRRWPRRRVPILVCVGTLLVAELLPAPRTLYSAAVPEVYRRVATAPADSRVLELPFGVRDGTWSSGNFTARSQYFQTMHGKPLIGGYLSRVSQRRRALRQSNPMLQGLMTLSEGGQLSPGDEARLLRGGRAFIADNAVAQSRSECGVTAAVDEAPPAPGAAPATAGGRCGTA